MFIFPVLTIFLNFIIKSAVTSEDNLPLVINTWGFINATNKAWEILQKTGSPLDALVEGCSVCEREQCDGTVGFGGSPDEASETTLDAMIMNGDTMKVGAVGALRRVKDVIAVARKVLENTKHSFLAGDQATDFAEMMGFKIESLTTAKSKASWREWHENGCQPNFRLNVLPDPERNCGPYRPTNLLNSPEKQCRREHNFGMNNHDTIGMIVIGKNQTIFAGTSTNGANHKIPGRVGDSPIPGAGAYAESKIGAAAATGDGDVMMRFLPAAIALEYLRQGVKPDVAGQYALNRIIPYYPDFVGGIIVATRYGLYGAACYGMKEFPYSVFKPGQTVAQVETVSCLP